MITEKPQIPANLHSFLPLPFCKYTETKIKDQTFCSVRLILLPSVYLLNFFLSQLTLSRSLLSEQP